MPFLQWFILHLPSQPRSIQRELKLIICIKLKLRSSGGKDEDGDDHDKQNSFRAPLTWQKHSCRKNIFVYKEKSATRIARSRVVPSRPHSLVSLRPHGGKTVDGWADPLVGSSSLFIRGSLPRGKIVVGELDPLCR
ncbi:hypothetical protein QYF36_023664 [Acer negundo]|nr:hypothetical protein QYF36_023664 [Acer negundo]